MKIYFKVIQKFYDNGSTDFNISKISAEEKPNYYFFERFEDYDYYEDFFETLEEAEDFVDSANYY